MRVLGLFPWKLCLSSSPLYPLVCGGLKTWLVCLLHPVSGAEVMSPVRPAPSVCPCSEGPTWLLVNRSGISPLTLEPGTGATSHLASLQPSCHCPWCPPPLSLGPKKTNPPCSSPTLNTQLYSYFLPLCNLGQIAFALWTVTSL